MATRLFSNVKLGLFVLAGLLFLVVLLFMIGKNRHLFGKTYLLKAKFENVQGLVPGNNVRFSGIQAGTVKKIIIINDTTIEVTMTLDDKMKNIIRKNAQVSIGTDGLVGNKVVNIVTAGQPADFARDGDFLPTKKGVNTEEMMQTLNATNKDISIIAEGLKYTVERVNNSHAFWTLLNDQSIPKGIKYSVSNIQSATAKANDMVNDLRTLVKQVKDGKGSLGELLTDSSFAQNLNEAVTKIKKVGDEADTLSSEINRMVIGVQQDINTGKGTIHALLKDSQLVIMLNKSLDNIQQGTDAFNQNMEALKHNFLFRGYFKKLDKQKKKEEAKRAKE